MQRWQRPREKTSFRTSMRSPVRSYFQIKSANVGCARLKNIRPPTNKAVVTTKRNTSEPIAGNASDRIALRNKPSSGVIGFQLKNLSNLPATGYRIELR